MKCNELMVGDWVADALEIPMQVISVGYTYAYAERNDENDYDWGGSLNTRNASHVRFS